MRLWPLGLALVIGAALGALLFGKHGPTKAERAADSTLATVPAWQDSLKQRDSLVGILDRGARALRTVSREQARIARLSKRRADSLQTLVDTILAPGSASDSVTQLSMIVDGQKRAAVEFQLTVGALEALHETDSTSLAMADRTLAIERKWRVQDQTRIDRLTKNLADLRNQTKHAGTFNVLGLHIPKCALPVAVGAAGGSQIDRDKPLRGALIGSASAVVGCLIS